MLQSACSADATEGAHRHGGAPFAGDDDALGTARVRPHLMRPALPDHYPTRFDQRCAHLPILLGHVFDRIARSGRASVLGWPDWRPPHIPSTRRLKLQRVRLPDDSNEERGGCGACLVPARSRPSAGADSRSRSRSARLRSRDVPAAHDSVLPLSRGGPCLSPKAGLTLRHIGPPRCLCMSRSAPRPGNLGRTPGRELASAYAVSRRSGSPVRLESRRQMGATDGYCLGNESSSLRLVLAAGGAQAAGQARC